MVTKPLASKTVYFDGQEPDRCDLNWGEQSRVDQLATRYTDTFTDGIVRTDLGTCELNIAASLVGANIQLCVCHGTAYLQGNRIEISADNCGAYLPAITCPSSCDSTSQAWNWEDCDGRSTPRSTGNATITIPAATICTCGYLHVAITHMDEVELCSSRTCANGFFINANDCFYRDYTHFRDGYILNYILSATCAFQTPTDPAGCCWLPLARICVTGTCTPVIDNTVRCYACLRAGAEPTADVEIHQQQFHTSGVADLTPGTNTYTCYALQNALPGSPTVHNLTTPGCGWQCAIASSCVLSIKAPFRNTNTGTGCSDDICLCYCSNVGGGWCGPIAPTNSIPMPNGSDRWLIWNLASCGNLSGVTNLCLCYVAACPGSVTYVGLGTAPQIESHIVSCTTHCTYNEYRIDVAPKTGPSAWSTTDSIVITFPTCVTDTPYYVNGKFLTCFSWNGTAVTPTGTQYLPVNSTNIPSPGVGASAPYYVILRDTGELDMCATAPVLASEIALAKVQATVGCSYETVGGVSLVVCEDYRSRIDSSTCYRVGNNITIAPLWTPTGISTVPDITLSACTDCWGQVSSYHIAPIACSGSRQNLLVSHNATKMLEFDGTNDLVTINSNLCVTKTEYVCCCEVTCCQFITCTLCVCGNTFLGNDACFDSTVIVGPVTICGNVACPAVENLLALGSAQYAQVHMTGPSSCYLNLDFYGTAYASSSFGLSTSNLTQLVSNSCLAIGTKSLQCLFFGTNDVEQMYLSSACFCVHTNTDICTLTVGALTASSFSQANLLPVSAGTGVVGCATCHWSSMMASIYCACSCFTGCCLTTNSICVGNAANPTITLCQCADSSTVLLFKSHLGADTGLLRNYGPSGSYNTELCSCSGALYLTGSSDIDVIGLIGNVNLCAGNTIFLAAPNDCSTVFCKSNNLRFRGDIGACANYPGDVIFETSACVQVARVWGECASNTTHLYLTGTPSLSAQIELGCGVGAGCGAYAKIFEPILTCFSFLGSATCTITPKTDVIVFGYGYGTSGTPAYNICIGTQVVAYGYLAATCRDNYSIPVARGETLTIQADACACVYGHIRAIGIGSVI